MSTFPLVNPGVLGFNAIPLTQTVFPSAEQVVFAQPTDEKFNGAHDYYLRVMTEFKDGAAVYGEGLLPIGFVKKNEDGTWRPGIQTEELLIMLLDRHEKLNEVFPSDEFNDFMMGIRIALEALERRVRERQSRGVFGEQKQ